MNIACALKDEITLTLPSTHDHNVLSTYLPPTLTQSLAVACHLTHDDVVGAWTLFNDVVWSGMVPMRSSQGILMGYKQGGRAKGEGHTSNGTTHMMVCIVLLLLYLSGWAWDA